MQLSLSSKDRHMLELFRAALCTDHIIYDRQRGPYSVSSLYVTSEELASDLLQFSPNTLLDCDSSTVHHLIRGIFDGDGSVHYSGANRQISICGEGDLLVALRELVTATLGTSCGCLRRETGIFRWFLGGRFNFRCFYDWMYTDASVYMNRKKLAFKF